MSQLGIALLNSSYLVRGNDDFTGSIGIQLSYIGWIAIGITAFEKSNRGLSAMWVLLAFAQFGGNLLFIDRTRPTWIIFTALLMMLVARPTMNIRIVVKKFCITAALLVSFFVLIAQWVGKVGEGVEAYGDTTISGSARIIYMYVTTGFPYLNAIIESEDRHTFEPRRLLYPVLKLASALDLSEAPPSQVVDVLYVPFPTNVGTFLEPFFRDGGVWFAVFGLLIYSFLFDFLGLVFLRMQRTFTYFGWAQICFASFIAFFTPKIASVPLWLFIGLACMSACCQWRVKTGNYDLLPPPQKEIVHTSVTAKSLSG